MLMIMLMQILMLFFVLDSWLKSEWLREKKIQAKEMTQVLQRKPDLYKPWKNARDQGDGACIESITYTIKLWAVDWSTIQFLENVWVCY